ncbi:hypothetical protein Tsp_09261 [Trichinella spiralis]|uniref:hypothetical protein n=1 Tax=Trichinella spiralis TaxID=6334 RepID=UPI0001EFC520|nr:hypothetical protein Tsp_09261 [Trichinella spiralis]
MFWLLVLWYFRKFSVLNVDFTHGFRKSLRVDFLKPCWKSLLENGGTSAPDHLNDVGVRVRGVFDQCTFMFIDNRSPSLNKANFHCFVLRCYHVRERTSVVSRPLTGRQHGSVANILVLRAGAVGSTEVESRK